MSLEQRSVQTVAVTVQVICSMSKQIIFITLQVFAYSFYHKNIMKLMMLI